MMESVRADQPWGVSAVRLKWVVVCLFVVLSCFPALGVAADDVQDTASVSGVVMDATGATVAGAQVVLLSPDNTALRTLTSGARGEFTFAGIPAGSYRVRVDAPGFATFLSNDIPLAEQQAFVVPPILLAVTAATDVTVRPTKVIAAEQIKAQEHQRVFGLVPNFYVSYVPDPAPLTSGQKLSLAAHDTFDWMSFVSIAAVAGGEQAANAHVSYGQGASGYAKRWAAVAADNISDDLLSHYVFASLLHQDPRYFYQGTGSRKSRLAHALGSAIIARSDNGAMMPNYAYLLGDVSSAAISNAYYPRADRTASWFLINAALGIAGRAGQAVTEEFIGKRFTHNVPPSS
jgi:Carboxypeptidase regulatory-like domain